MPILETVGVVVGAAGVLQPAFQACRDLWKGWRLIQTFGSDFGEQRRNLDIQVTLLDELSKRRLRNLRNKQLDPWDENNEVTKRVVDLLVNICKYFAECDRLVKKYSISDLAESDNESASFSQSPQPGSHSSRHTKSIYSPRDDSTEAQFPPQNTAESHKSPDEEPLTGSNGKGQNPMLHKIRTKFRSMMKNRNRIVEKRMVPPSNASDNLNQIHTHTVVPSPFRQNESGVGLNISPPTPPPKRLTTANNTASTMSKLHTIENSARDDLHATTLSSPPLTGSSSSSSACTSTLPHDPLTPATSMGSSILDSQVITSASHRANIQSVSIDKANSFGRKVIWSADDLDLLDKQISKLWTANQILRSLLELETPEGLEHVLGQETSADPRLRHLGLIQDNLLRLHESLASANGMSPADSIEISLHLTANHEEQTIDFIAQEDHLKFRKDPCILFLQMQDPAAEKESVQVASETTPVSSAETNDRLQHLPSLYEHLKGNTLIAGQGYSPFGSVCRLGSPLDFHNLFLAQDTKWCSSTTLEKEIASKEFQEELNPIQRSQLASLLAISHLHVVKLRSACGHLRPADLRFYHVRGDSNMWCNDEPYVLNPWLCFGFGSRKPKRNIAASSGISRKTNNPVIELGLLLFQIGGCQAIDYGIGADGFRKARNDALRSLELVDSVSGPNFAEAVAACLQFRDSPFDAVTREDEEIVVRHVIRWLELLELSLEK